MREAVFSALVLTASALAAITIDAVPASAQAAVEGRVERLEGEMRAVQRKVFPGGSGQYVQPDNSPAPPQDILPGTPATSPVADLATRVDADERQMRTITGQVEINDHRIQLLEARMKTLEANAAAAPAATPVIVPAPALVPTPTPDKSTGKPVEKPTGETAANKPRLTPDKPADKPSDKPAARPADPARAAKVAAVERPDSGDMAEDTYLYGYRLWVAKLYPEAEAQFLAVTTKFPTHKRASYAQNLLGRSYLDDGKPSLASLAFLDNYKKWPDGDRAPESLIYLADALVTLKKPVAQVCKVYTELDRSYAAKIAADPKLKAGIIKGRAASNCP